MMATLTNTESGIINYEQIIEWLIEYIESNNLNVKGIMYDPWSANSLVAKLEA
jgi:phage terminase large subunit-like protein